MKGLLVKDGFTILHSGKPILIIILFSGGLSFLRPGNMFFATAMFIMIMLATIIGLFQYDESAKWERYAVTLPLTRRQIVGARYITALLLLACGLAISLIIGTTSSLFNGMGVAEFLPALLISSSVMAALYLLVVAVTFPFAIKLGAEKARYAMNACYIVPLFLITLLGNRIEAFLLSVAGLPAALLCGGVALVLLGAFAASYASSVKMFTSREF